MNGKNNILDYLALNMTSRRNCLLYISEIAFNKYVLVAYETRRIHKLETD